MPENSNRTGQPTIQEADPATLLSTINSPDDLRHLQVTQLPQICAEIREFLINSLSVNPGHFASSMGAVELTVALHYVFNTPYDRIVWDVGHQAYVHKILTGRRDLFHTNRTFGGLSGFPNPAESPYDTFTAGHASNSISAALGMAVASESKHESPRRNVVAVIGDASISGGLAFEGLNNAANTPNNLLIILNDNDMSIDRNVGSLSSYLGHLNTSKAYNSLRFHLFHLLKKLHLIKDSQKGFLIRFANSLKSLLNRQQNIFEGLNIRYFGPIDGHDTARLVKVLSDIKDMHGPRLLHIRTVKGRGYAPAESNPASWHAPGKFDPATGRRDEENDSGRTAAPKYQEIFGQTLLELARADKRVVGITAAMPSGTSMNILQEAMPERVFDVGISEGHAVTFAGGLAKDGMRPFVAIYSSFMQRAYDHIIHDVAIQGLPVTLCLDRAGIVGEDGVTHHGVFDLCYLRSIPGMTVAAPRDESTLRNLMYTSLQQDGPMAIRYPRGRVHRRPTSAPCASDMTALPIGRGVKLREGKDVAVLSLGTIGNIAADAVADAIARGIDTAHYDMIFLKPLDENILHEVGRSGMPIVTVEDGMIHGGFGSAVLEWLNEHGYRQQVRCIGVDDTFVEHGRVPQLMHLCGMDRDAITDAIESARKQSTTCE